MTLRDRIGVDVGRKLPLEDAIAWAAEHQVRFIDVQLDTGANALGTIDAARARRDARRRANGTASISACTPPRRSMSRNMRPLSATRSTLSRSLCRCRRSARRRMDRRACRVPFHLRPRRAHAGRAANGCSALADYAEQKGALILLENLNKEPEDAEVHYLAHTVEEWRFYFDAIGSPAFRLSFTVNHAHLVPEGIAGFVDALDFAPGSTRCGSPIASATATRCT